MKYFKVCKAVFITILAVCAVLTYIDLFRFPECYSSIQRYQLYNKIKKGDVEAIDYYYRVYILNGRHLFDDIGGDYNKNQKTVDETRS